MALVIYRLALALALVAGFAVAAVLVGTVGRRC